MRQVRFIVDPMGCGPLGGSVTTVTEYTGSTVTCHKCWCIVTIRPVTGVLNIRVYSTWLYLDKWLPHLCHVKVESQFHKSQSDQSNHLWQFFTTTVLYLDNTQSHSTLTNDSHISAMVTVAQPHTTPAALCQVGFSTSTVDVSKNWSTSLSKVSTTNSNCSYKCHMSLQYRDLLWTCLNMKNIPKVFMPSCLHTTVAPFLPKIDVQLLPHTVPQNPSTQISTLPSLSLSPPTRRRSPELHSSWEVVFPWQITLATGSLLWWCQIS